MMQCCTEQVPQVLTSNPLLWAMLLAGAAWVATKVESKEKKKK